MNNSLYKGIRCVMLNVYGKSRVHSSGVGVTATLLETRPLTVEEQDEFQAVVAKICGEHPFKESLEFSTYLDHRNELIPHYMN